MRGQAGAVAAALVAGGLLAAGCGGGKPSAVEQWQDSVCSAMNDYVGQISGYANDISTQLRSPHVGMEAEIRATVKQGQAATNRLGTRLEALGVPPVDNGKTAQQLVDGLSTNLQRSAAHIQQEANALGGAGSLTEAVTSITSIAAEVSNGVARTKSTVDSLQNLNSELKNGFDHIDSCKKLQKHFGG